MAKFSLNCIAESSILLCLSEDSNYFKAFKVNTNLFNNEKELSHCNNAKPTHY